MQVSGIEVVVSQRDNCFFYVRGIVLLQPSLGSPGISQDI